MAVVSGATGDISFSLGSNDEYEELHAHLFAWTMRVVSDQFDATTFATSDVGRVVEMGLYTVRGSCRGFLDRHTHIVAASLAPDRQNIAVGSTLTLTPFTGATYTLKAIVNNFGFASSKQGGLNSLTFDFVNDGPFLTY